MKIGIKTCMAGGLFLLLSAGVEAQPLSYSLLRSEAVAPTPRFDGTIAYDPAQRRVYLFGGQDTAPRNDVWAYDLGTRRWEEIQASGARPPARFGHTMLFDPARRRLVVFGGQAGGFFSDVWAFDIQRRAWQQLSQDEGGPSRRYGHSAVLDTARDRLVISHGFTDSGRFDDTWSFDFATNSWRNLTPSGTRPLRRCLHHAVLDAANNQMYLYGGCASGFGPCPLGDLWSFDLTTNRWMERTGQPNPPAREHYGMAFDAVRGRVVIFGGSGSGLLNDTWEYDTRSGQWRQPSISGDLPAPRHRHESTVATDRGTIFFFGGVTSSGTTNDLWMLGPGFILNQPQVAQGGVINAFSGQVGAVAPGELVSILGSGLGPITGISFASDPLTGHLPTSGPGLSVTWNGIPAPLYFARSDQLNVQVPYELEGTAEARLVVTVNGQESESVIMPLAPTKPGLFPMVWNQDGSVNSADNPAAPGNVIVLYATGQGTTNPASRTGALARDLYPEPVASLSVRIAGQEAQVLFRGQAPGTAGVIQINARIPPSVSFASLVPLTLSIGGSEAQAGVRIAVR